MILANTIPLLVCLLFVLFVMSVVRVEQIRKLPHFVLRMGQFDLGIVEMGVFQFMPQVWEGMFDLLFQASVARTICHVCWFGGVWNTTLSASYLVGGERRRW